MITNMTLTDTAPGVVVEQAECERHGFVAAPTVGQARALIAQSSIICWRCRGVANATRSDGWILDGVLIQHRP